MASRAQDDGQSTGRRGSWASRWRAAPGGACPPAFSSSFLGRGNSSLQPHHRPASCSPCAGQASAAPLSAQHAAPPATCPGPASRSSFAWLSTAPSSPLRRPPARSPAAAWLARRGRLPSRSAGGGVSRTPARVLIQRRRGCLSRTPACALGRHQNGSLDVVALPRARPAAARLARRGRPPACTAGGARPGRPTRVLV